MKRIWATGCMFLALLWMAGCASTPRTLEYEAQTAKVWPAPPEKARYRYVGQLTGEANFKGVDEGVTVGNVLRWIVGTLAGEGKPKTLERPQAVLVDDKGRIIVTDVNRGAVFVFDTVEGGLEIWEWASGNDRFVAPIGLAAFEDWLYVADAELGYIAVLNIADGEPVGRIEKGLTRPTGLAVDKVNRRLYVADTREHTIKVYEVNGKGLKSFGRFGAKEGELNGPTYLAFADGKVYVADTLNARIQIFTADGEFIRAFGRRGRRYGEFSRPKGIAVDPSGLIYVVESFYDHLLVFDQKGQLLLPIGGEGRGVGQFYLPSGVWVDNQSKVYIADVFNGRIVVLQYLEGA